MTLHLQFTATVPGFSVDITGELPSSGITAVMGKSGSGKTTFLRSLAGLQPITGRIQWTSTTWCDSKERIFLAPHQRRIGYVFQDLALFPHLSVEANIRYGWKRIPADRARPDIDALTEAVSITALRTRAVSDLSGGERQRVALARALLSAPDVLFLDEPFAALDRQASVDLAQVLLDVHATYATPMLLVSHNVADVARLADHLVMIERGTITRHGPALSLLAQVEPHHDNPAGPQVYLDATCVQYHASEALAEWHYKSLILFMPIAQAPKRTVQRLALRAADISISLHLPTDSSILNYIPATITELSSAQSGRLTVTMLADDLTLYALITQRSATHLALTSGMRIFAGVKAVALA